MHKICSETGLPLEPAKTEGPLFSLTFLGIELDSEKMEICLPQDKLAKALETLDHWRDRKAAKKQDLLSLIGTLAHSIKVIQSSRIFLHRIINLSTTTSNLNHFIRLNAEAKSDIEWWFQFMNRWNGILMLPLPNLQSAALVVDASGNWGCGAYWGQEWFQLKGSQMLAGHTYR